MCVQHVDGCPYICVWVHVLYVSVRFVSAHLPYVYLQTRASVQEVVPVVSALPQCHLERKSSVKYSIVWDKAPRQWLSS